MATLSQVPMRGSAVLFSGGLDSAVLLAQERERHAPVLPVHVRAGLAWEAAEARAIASLLRHPIFARGVEPVVTLDLDMRDVYPPSHWAIRGEPPAFDTPDEQVYLDGRNVVLIAKTAVLCARRGIGRLALGPLAGNPFPDATPEFFAAMSRAISLGLAHEIEVATPLAHLHKDDVIRLGLDLGVPLELTRSCMSPTALHCGECSKCRERRDAFRTAGVEDRTFYEVQPAR
jgi:7-cyano-7-deazaguanine synthase